jgi:cyclopropane-fatty-acyl-phospholipid synthase
LRVWRLSLALSTVGFERDRIGVHQLLAVRPHADGRSGMLA